MGRFSTVTLITASLLAPPSFAQDVTGASQGGADKEIVVKGAQQLDSKDVAQRIRDGYPMSVLREPVMRYHDPVCVQANGLGPAGDAEVESAMRDTIRSLGIPLASEGCRANAVVVVSTEPVAQLERIHKRTPRVLAADTLAEKANELASGAHFAAWHNRTVRGADGEALPIAGWIAGYSGPPIVNGLVNNNGGRPSRYRAGYSVAADVGVIVYDAKRLVDVELKQLANNAVMRLLAPGFAMDVEPGAPETVLSGIEQGQGPTDLTRFDRAMLTALYDMAPNELGLALSRSASKAFEKDDES